MKKTIRSFFLNFTYLSFHLIFILSHSAHTADRRTFSLLETLRMAENFSPNVKAAERNEEAAHQSLRISLSLYYPTLDATLVDSTGFPGAYLLPNGFNTLPGGYGNLSDGFNGLMNSPYRVGLAGGVFTTLTFFDLSREYRRRASSQEILFAQEQIKLSKLNVDLQTMNLYLNAVSNRAQRDAWREIQTEINRLYGVVKKYVRNGQYSQVTQWLLKSQSEDAERRMANLDIAYQQALHEIEIETGLEAGSLDVQGLSTIEEGLNELSKAKLPQSPLVEAPKLLANANHEFAAQQSALNWPKILGVASAGGMENSRLVPLKHYSVWIGLTIPIFKGFRISAEASRATAEAERQEEISRNAQLELAKLNAKYQMETQARINDLKKFQIQRDLSLKAMKLAEYRLVTFIGDLADVRDSLYSYVTAESGLKSAEIEAYRSKLAQAIVNGGILSD